MTYIQDKLDAINIFDYIVFEYGDIDTEKSNEKLKKLLTDYHNHIVEKVKNYSYEDLDKEELSWIMKDEIIALLQDTNPNE